MQKNSGNSVVGIVAEYNPFHNGHQYHIQMAKELTASSYCVAVMSGDFVQRGAPAVYDKYTRTAMALYGGADLVLELPSVFAVGSAEDFAGAAAALLNGLGVVDALCFGSECGDIHSLSRIAHILAKEPDDYTDALKKQLRSGVTFPKARSAALFSCEELQKEPVSDSLLNAPNNILGIEYLKALIRQHSPILPYTIARSGSGYHDTTLSGGFSSASGIRRVLETQMETDLIHTQMPVEAVKLLSGKKPLFTNDFSALLNTSVLRLIHQDRSLCDYMDISAELEARIRKFALEYSSFEACIQQLKTKQYTYTRISRALLHLMLDIRKAHYQAYRNANYISYARVLGFRKNSTPLLSMIKDKGTLPLITKTADASQILKSSPLGQQMLRQDFYCSHTYNAIWSAKYHETTQNEYNRQIVIL